MFGNARGLLIVAPLLASACFGGRKLTDTDPNPVTTDDGSVNAELAELCPAEDFVAECGDDPAPSLTASSTTPGRIDVEHRGLEIGCGTWSADATVLEDTITIDYLSAEDTTADCACAWTFTYWLPVERAGTFTIEAEGDSVVVTVQ